MKKRNNSKLAVVEVPGHFGSFTLPRFIDHVDACLVYTCHCVIPINGDPNNFIEDEEIDVCLPPRFSHMIEEICRKAIKDHYNPALVIKKIYS